MCLQTTSEKRIRQQLASELGVPMDEHKAFVRKHVMHVIDHMDERETLEPLPYTDDEDEEDGAGGKGRKAKGKGKEQPHVVVVGAGPAGLAAATVLQVRIATCALVMSVKMPQRGLMHCVTSLCSPAPPSCVCGPYVYDWQQLCISTHNIQALPCAQLPPMPCVSAYSVTV